METRFDSKKFISPSERQRIKAAITAMEGERCCLVRTDERLGTSGPSRTMPFQIWIVDVEDIAENGFEGIVGKETKVERTAPFEISMEQKNRSCSPLDKFQKTIRSWNVQELLVGDHALYDLLSADVRREKMNRVRTRKSPNISNVASQTPSQLHDDLLHSLVETSLNGTENGD